MFTREYGALAGVGGVKDVTAQLSRSLARWSGRTVKVVLPLYGFMNPREMGFSRLADPDFPDTVLAYEVTMNYTDRARKERVRVWYKVVDRVHLYLLESQRFPGETRCLHLHQGRFSAGIVEDSGNRPCRLFRHEPAAAEGWP